MRNCPDPFCTSSYPCDSCRTDIIGELITLSIEAMGDVERRQALKAEEERRAFTREWVRV